MRPRESEINKDEWGDKDTEKGGNEDDGAVGERRGHRRARIWRAGAARSSSESPLTSQPATEQTPADR